MRNTAQLLLASFPSFSPKDISGLVGWYRYDSRSGTTWYDLSGNGNHATLSGTLIDTEVVSGNGASSNQSALWFKWDGGTGYGTCLWPSNILPSTYTLFHVSRYRGVVNNRILQGYDANWLSGHWANNTPACYHNAWLYYPALGTNNNWAYYTDQNNLFRRNGTTLATSGAGSPSYARLSINTSVATSEWSDAAVAEVLVYNSNLSATDYGKVEDYLKSLYGL